MDEFAHVLSEFDAVILLDIYPAREEPISGVSSEILLQKIKSNNKYLSKKSKDFASELMSILKSKRDEIVFKMKLTSKDEFEVLSKRVENLEKKIDQLKIQKKRKST